jgi:hypothetical protein
MFKIKAVFRDISNFLYLRKVIKKNRNSDKWKKLNLRHSWFYTIYTVTNLPIEVIESEEVYHAAFVIENLKETNEYLESLNLQEIVYLNTLPIEGENAFLCTYTPLMENISFGFFFKWLAVIATLLFFRQEICDFIIFIYDLILTLHLKYKTWKQ